MSMSNSRLSFKAYYNLYEKALHDPKGVKLRVTNMDEAWHIRSKLHWARKLDRDDNMRIFKEDDRMYGLSDYDKITCRIKQINGQVWLLLVRDDTEFDIVSLSEEENEQHEATNSNRREVDRTEQEGEAAREAEAQAKAKVRRL